MNTNEILSRVDHTLLSPSATWKEIKGICDDGIKYRTASVCIPPSYVKKAAEYACGRIKICTVIGFPNGYNTTAVKVAETEEAVACGADEIDMVINLGWVKDGEYGLILDEIKEIKKACRGKLLKVIIETCLLSDEEKIKLCDTVSRSGADYIKTSTGFSSGGATFRDVELMRKNSSPSLKVKAAGGISSMEDAQKMIELGADRLGTSRIVKIVKSEENDERGY